MKKEDSRLKKFRQLRNEIRGSEKHLLVGIGIGKEKQNAFLGTATGKTPLIQPSDSPVTRFFNYCSVFHFSN